MYMPAKQKIEILRLYGVPIGKAKQTEGILYLIEDNKIIFECHTLELPWKDNKFRVSCIPSGTYTGVIHTSPKFGKCIWLQDVPDRTEILIHSANYVRQLLGCIAVGEAYIDMDKDGLRDVTNSKKTLNKILSLLQDDEIEIKIKWR